MAKSLDNNSSVELKEVTNLEISAEIESPVVSLTISGICKEKIPPLGKIVVWKKNDKIFEGKVDLQKLSFNEKGTEICIEARNAGSLLLDNEAKPETLWGANSATIFSRHIGRYGFSLFNETEPATMAVYSIKKSTSQWDVFCEFVRRLNGIKPYVIDNQVYIRRLGLLEPSIVFDNSNKNSVHYTEFEHTIVPYNLISKLYLRDEFGEYSASVNNSLAEYYQIKRERYIIPPTELLTMPQVDANQKIENSINKLESYTLKTTKVLSPKLGDTVEINAGFYGKKRLIIVGYSLSAREIGYSTTLKLKEPYKL